MAIYGDRILSFGGYTFVPGLCLSIDYPQRMRHQLRTIPGADYKHNPFGTTAPPLEATDLTMTYWLNETSAGAPITTNAGLKAELAAIRTALASVGTGTLVTQERDGTTSTSCSAVFVSLDPPTASENLVDLMLTIVFTPLTPFA